MKRGWIAGLVAVMLCAWTQTASAGPVILAGHDADDHTGTSGTSFDAYVDLFNALLGDVTNLGSGILAIGADVDTTAGDWIEAIAAAMDTAQAVTFVNDADISTESFAGYAIIFIPSDSADTGGGITGAENALLTARADDIADFVNGGGGLFGLTQGELADAYGYITGAGGLGAITTLSVDPSGFLPSGDLYNDVSATPAGEALGLSDTNVDGCCWHNVFTSFPSFFEVLAVAETPDPDDAAFDQEAAVIGGSSVTITPVVPEPSSMLLFGLGGLGAGVIRRRRKLNNI
jgi:hypothetical protein